MKIKELNAIKRKHNRLLKAGQELFAELEPISAEMLALRKKIEEAEGDDYDPIPVLFGSGFWIDVEGEEAEEQQNG